MKKSKAFGVVVLPENFTRYMYVRLTDQSSATAKVLDGSTVNVSFDSTGMLFFFYKEVLICYKLLLLNYLLK